MLADVSLLNDIQKAATNPKTSVADLLRLCQILAARLRHDRFRAWVSHELNGYESTDGLPTYRGPMRGELKANIIGFTARASDVAVPHTNIPAEVRDEVLTLNFLQGVGELAEMVAHAQRTDN